MKSLKLILALILITSFNAACGNTGTTVRTANQTASKNAPQANANEGASSATPAAASEHAAAIDLYQRIGCAACHGADGKGNATMKDIPNFADAAWQKTATDEAMINVIKTGKPPMPAYKNRLTDEQVKAMVAYIRSFAKP